jgi:hypothetical protein
VLAALQHTKSEDGTYAMYRAAHTTPEQLRQIMHEKRQFSVIGSYMGDADQLRLEWDGRVV